MFQRAIKPLGPAAQPVLALGKAMTLTLRAGQECNVEAAEGKRDKGS